MLIRRQGGSRPTYMIAVKQANGKFGWDKLFYDTAKFANNDMEIWAQTSDCAAAP